MVIVQLIGGLGNQLFQYALGRRIALENKTSLKLDITGFETYKLHAYSLQHFDIVADIASRPEIDRLKPLRQFQGPSKFLLRYVQKLGYRRTWIREHKPYQFDPTILKMSGNIYLEGFWQNEKYFETIASVIRKELNIKTQPYPVDIEVAQKIENAMAVSVHVRRADYASNSATQKHHGLLTLDYYFRAVERLRTLVDDPHFFIFSDDTQWVQENLQLEYPVTYVSHNNADKNYEDLRLMALCTHHIIANSSFSWWGAWLSANRDKIVFAPKQWLNNPDFDTADVTPASWVRL